MSNQVGLMLSFIFLAILIIFSGELIAYQQFNAQFIADTGQIAHKLQVDGYDFQYVDYVQLSYDMNYLSVDVSSVGDVQFMKLETRKKYKSFSGLFKFMDNEMTCKMTIYRKE